jgi:hypothetical protein
MPAGSHGVGQCRHWIDVSRKVGAEKSDVRHELACSYATNNCGLLVMNRSSSKLGWNKQSGSTDPLEIFDERQYYVDVGSDPSIR